MKKFLLGLIRFGVAFIGIGLLTAGLGGAQPRTLYLIAALIMLFGLILFFKPVKIGWLQNRSFASGLLIGSLMIPLAGVEISDDANGPLETTETQVVEQNGVGEVKESNLSEKTRQDLWILKSQEGVRARLKDPESAQFRNVYFVTYQQNTPMVCGEVNSKNGFGGYSGFQRFVASGTDLAFLEDDMSATEFRKVWDEIC